MADEADMADAIVAEHIARGLTAIDPAIPAGVAGECDGCGEVMPRLVGGLCGFCRDGRRPPLSWFDADRAPAPAPSPSIPSNKFASPPGGTIRSGEDDARGAVSRTPPVPEAAPQPDPQPEAPTQPAPAPSPEETEMVSYASGAKPITVPTPPEVYHHIDALAESLGLPMGRAALVLIERGISVGEHVAVLHSDDADQISARHFADKQIDGGADAEFRMGLQDAPSPLPIEQLSTDALLAEIKRRTEQVDDPLLDEAVARAEAAESQLAAIKQLLGQGAA